MKTTKKQLDAFPSLLKYLKATGKIHSVTQAQLYKARHLFVSRGYSEQDVAESLELPESVIVKWVNAFQWSEDRDRILYRKLRSVRELSKKAAEVLDERHDRILSSVETLAERILAKSIDGEGEALTPKDLKAVVDSLKTSAEMRRQIHKKEGPARRQVLSIEAPEVFKQVAAAVMSAATTQKQLSSSRGADKLEIQIKPAQDAEFDMLEGNDDAS